MSVASMSIQQLLEQRTLIDTQICLKTGGSVAGPIIKVKLTKGGKVKKAPSDRKGKPTANGDFTKKVLAEHKSDYEEYKAANPEKKGVHLTFVSEYKKANDEEWKAFEASWIEAHPKDSPTGSVAEAGSAEASDDGNTMVTAASSEKPKRVLTPEHKAAMQAGRLAKKAAKEAEASGFSATTVVMASPNAPAVATVAAPVVATPPVKKVKKSAKKAEPIVEPAVISSNVSVASEDDEGAELIPFKHGGVTYMRLGSKREDGNHLWATADLWANKKGLKGNYIGTLLEDGSVDTDALEPILE
jgi:hypothetical protein